jgi:predicted transcriptional regulator/transcriptional regulator with XRE-family HTH domain
MAKLFMGVRLRQLREQRGLSQAALARSLQLSPSYLNQIEHDQRPLSAAVLRRLGEELGVDARLFADHDESRLITDLRAALADQGADVPLTQIRELVASAPDVARAVISMQQRLLETTGRADLLAGRLDSAGIAAPADAFEAVREWFYKHRNYVDQLDRAAEAIGRALTPGQMLPGLIDRLAGRHGIRIAIEHDSDHLRRFDPQNRILHLASHLRSGQRVFQIATQLAYLEKGELIDRLSSEPGMGADARGLLRIGLSNYFAGALLLPYGDFLQTAEDTRYDIELLAERFGVGFETVCHRLSTLQRPDARGVPFFFIRVDRAGNISKRQSATDFHFSRIGGSCPLWNVYAAFARPDEVLRQVAQMPDGSTYLWIARMVSHTRAGFRAPSKSFAVALGCDLGQAEKLIYGRGLDLKNPTQATPIGPGCKLCERPACPQRAFPTVGRPLALTTNEIGFAPYASGSD